MIGHRNGDGGINGTLLHDDVAAASSHFNESLLYKKGAHLSP
jgi:hypothetical protein